MAHRDWLFNFQATGKKGDVKVMETISDCDSFIAEALMHTPGGHITSIKVGGKEQDLTMRRRTAEKHLFSRPFDACGRSVQMTVTVEFDEDCSFDCAVLGKANVQ